MYRFAKRFSLSAALACALAGTAHAEAPLEATNGVMLNAAGMTVYTFDKDVARSGKSACNGQLCCAVAARHGRSRPSPTAT